MEYKIVLRVEDSFNKSHNSEEFTIEELEKLISGIWNNALNYKLKSILNTPALYRKDK